MSSSEKIKLSIVPNPFKTARIDLEVDRISFGELFTQFVDSPLTIEHALIFDGDIRVDSSAFKGFPESNHVIIKMVPSGTGSTTKDIGVAAKIGGAALAVLGVIITIATLGAGAPIGAFLIGTGVSMFLSGVMLYNIDIPSLANRESNQLPSIRGAKNQTRFDGMVPILLGKHLIIPDNAALPYVEIVNDKQVLHQLFCLGYSDIQVDTSTIKIGNTSITNFVSANYEIRQDGVAHNYYPIRVVQNDLAIEMKVSTRLADGTYTTENSVTRSTSTNCKAVSVTVSAPRGLAIYNEDGKHAGRMSFRVEYSKDNGVTWGVLESGAYHGTRTLWTEQFSTTSVRLQATYPLDNDTPAGADYNLNRQYLIRVFKLGFDSSTGETTVVADAYLDNIQSHVASYVGNNFDSNVPIVLDTQAKLTTMSIAVQADNQLQGVVDDFNMVAQLHTLKYDGGGSGPSFWSVGATSNPAAMFRYILQDNKVNPHPIGDAKVDWASLELWYNFCETNSFECNAVINGDTTVETILGSIASSGRATWLPIDGLYTIIIDTIRPNIVQMFTPRNSWEFTGYKSFSDEPTVLKMQFIDEATGYTSAERRVYFNDLIEDDSLSQSVELFGTTTADTAWRIGKYLLAINRLRPESFTFKVDIENLICIKGDRVTLAHDAALIGLYQGRIKTIYTDVLETQIEGFESDEELTYEMGKTYAVKVRTIEGVVIDYPITNPVGVTHVVEFVTPIPGIIAIKSSDLFVMGEAGEETLDLIIAQITPSNDLVATLTCINYAPEVFDADTGTIPEYNALISVPGEGSSVDVSVGSSLDLTAAVVDLNTQNAINAGAISKVGGSLIASRGDAFSLNTEMVEVAILDDGSVVGVGIDDFKLYSFRKTDSFPPVILGNELIRNPYRGGLDVGGNARILYVNMDDNNRIYMRTKTVGDTGSPITATAGQMPRYIESDEFLYLDLNGMLYRGLVTDALDGTQVSTTPVWDYAVFDSTSIIYANILDSSTLYNKSSIADTAGVKLGDLVASKVSYSPVNANTVYFLAYNDDLNIYRKDAASVLDEGVPVFISTLTLDVDANNDLVFVSLLDPSFVYSGLNDPAVAGGFLEAAPNQFYITGDLTVGSNKITNISIDDLAQLVVKDNTYHLEIPTGASVLFKGNNYLLMDEDASATVIGTAIQIAGTRIVLDANRVIIDGTVTANLLESSAINSKAKDVNGDNKTEIDLDNATYKFRKDDGTVVLDFDADRAGRELLIQGTIASDNFAAGLSGWEINNDGNAEFNDGVFRGHLAGATGEFNGDFTAPTIHTASGITVVNSDVFPSVIDQAKDVVDWAISIGIPITKTTCSGSWVYNSTALSAMWYERATVTTGDQFETRQSERSTIFLYDLVGNLVDPIGNGYSIFYGSQEFISPLVGFQAVGNGYSWSLEIIFSNPGGLLQFPGLPVTDTGLASDQVWRDGDGFLKIT